MKRSDSNHGTSQRRNKINEPRQAGRPRQKGNIVDATKPRDDILKAAANLFSLKGYAGTTMAEIADSVGIRGPSLYYHFSKKADVLRALVEVGLTLATEGLESAGRRDQRSHSKSRPLSAAVQLYQLVHEVVFRWRSSPYEFSCLFDPALQTKEFSDIKSRLESWTRDVETIIQRGIASEDFLVQDAHIATYIVCALVAPAIRDLRNDPSISTLQMADYVADFALRALLRNHSCIGDIRRVLGYDL